MKKLIKVVPEFAEDDILCLQGLARKDEGEHGKVYIELTINRSWHLQKGLCLILWDDGEREYEFVFPNTDVSSIISGWTFDLGSCYEDSEGPSTIEEMNRSLLSSILSQDGSLFIGHSSGMINIVLKLGEVEYRQSFVLNQVIQKLFDVI
ncbi:MAG: hypothetical protein KC582_04335 [Candidatus Magasanikbacteria bacterium]|nr:hypothetical protein [Candidatus Magasanikbacteria bacterium]MCA9389650.1 hypothetical protein [Candidatus Magasanikbacteria bacterium]MCA9391455.1 hypothetical protein [Candidatus Magasanikbacteria bacterium]USN52048.1 MAG: hypothetical protein H6759_03375 [Candidatus Nomurabacteria bacterium]HPF95241.1 hypothetical protein [bacterium]